MPSTSRWSGPALAGLACSMRSMSGPAMLAAHGRITGRPATALFLAGAGEVVADKTSFAIDRIAPPSLAGRIGTGAVTGYVIGGPMAAVVAASAAGLGTYATFHLRKALVAATGRPDFEIAVGEDVCAYALAFVTTGSPAAA